MAIRKKDVAALPHDALVELVWTLKRGAERSARSPWMSGPDLDLCTITPRNVLDTISDRVSG